VEHTDEQIAAMSLDERSQADIDSNPIRVYGNVPPETQMLVEGIYGLTGASVLRDDRTAEDPTGEVIRQGEYQGSPVYFSENHGQIKMGGFWQPCLRIDVIGKKSAKTSLDELSKAEFKEFKELMGLNGVQALKTLPQNDGSRHNYRDIA